MWFVTHVHCPASSLRVQIGTDEPTVAFYVLPSRFWQLVSGAILFTYEDSRPSPLDLTVSGSLIVEAAAVLLLAAALLYTPSSPGFPMPWSLLAVAGTIFTILAGSCVRHPVGCYGWRTPLLHSFLSLPTMVYVGKLSYPLYLWHWPVLVIAKWSMPIDTWQKGLAVVCTIFAGASFLYHVVEARFRRWRPRRKTYIFLVFLPMIFAVEGWLGLLRGPLRESFFVQSSAAATQHLDLPSPSSPSIAPTQGFPSPSQLPCPSHSPLPAPSRPPSPSLPPPQPVAPPPPPALPAPPKSPSPLGWRFLITAPPPLAPSPLPPAHPRPPKRPPPNPQTPPPRPPPPSYPPPELCYARSETGRSVYTSRFPTPPVKGGSASLSNFPARKCACSRQSSRPIHSPPVAVGSGAATVPCFTSISTHDQQYMGRTNTYLFTQPCVITGGSNGQVHAAVRACLDPPRTGSLPQRAIFMFGDSHLGVTAPAIQAAVDGAASVTFVAGISGCGLASNEYLDDPKASRFHLNKNLCSSMNEAIDSTLRARLQKCDIVIVHQSWRKNAYNLQQSARVSQAQRLRSLADLVLRKGASLVLIGDVAELPKERGKSHRSSLSASLTSCVRRLPQYLWGAGARNCHGTVFRLQPP